MTQPEQERRCSHVSEPEHHQWLWLERDWEKKPSQPAQWRQEPGRFYRSGFLFFLRVAEELVLRAQLCWGVELLAHGEKKHQEKFKSLRWGDTNQDQCFGLCPLSPRVLEFVWDPTYLELVEHRRLIKVASYSELPERPPVLFTYLFWGVHQLFVEKRPWQWLSLTCQQWWNTIILPWERM